MSAEKNYQFFQRQLPTILASHRGQFALVRAEQIVGFYPNIEAALKDAYQRFQDNDFLIQEVTDEDRLNHINLLNVRSL